MQSFVFLVFVGLCVLSVSGAGIPIPKPDHSAEANSVESRQYHGIESFSGPGTIMFAPVIAVAFLVLLWVAAFNTIRDAPPRFSLGGYGRPLDRASGVHTAAAVAEVVPAASNPVAAVSVGARAFDQLTQRVLSSIEKMDAAA